MSDTLTQVLSLLEKSPDVNAQAARQMLVDANLVELPCKVGDTVYAVAERKILKCRVTEICIASYGISYVQLFSKDDRLANFKYDYFCKTVFLTESAAREALEAEHEL